jgi:glycosyltransferase involved in cell wall biosynthesis
LDSKLKDKIRLIIIGSSSIKIINNLLKMIEEKKLKNQIYILPPVEYSKISKYIINADVGVIPLPLDYIFWQVSAPLKTLEYLAAKKPIIATKIPFHQKIFDKGNCGILLDNATPHIIADGINQMYNKRKELKNMGKIGREIVYNYYTWDYMAKELEIFLKKFYN